MIMFHVVGGLDVRGDMTGEHSVYTTHGDHEIMFHVSTLLPYSPDDKQQVANISFYTLFTFYFSIFYKMYCVLENKM